MLIHGEERATVAVIRHSFYIQVVYIQGGPVNGKARYNNYNIYQEYPPGGGPPLPLPDIWEPDGTAEQVAGYESRLQVLAEVAGTTQLIENTINGLRVGQEVQLRGERHRYEVRFIKSANNVRLWCEAKQEGVTIRGRWDGRIEKVYHTDLDDEKLDTPCRCQNCENPCTFREIIHCETPVAHRRHDCVHCVIAAVAGAGFTRESVPEVAYLGLVASFLEPTGANRGMVVDCLLEEGLDSLAEKFRKVFGI